MMEENKSKMENKSKLSVNRELPKFSDNHYSLLVKNKLEEEKMEEFKRLNYGHEMKEKICKFQEHVNQDFKPKLSKKNKFVPSKQSFSAKSLSYVDRRNKGMEYL